MNACGNSQIKQPTMRYCKCRKVDFGCNKKTQAKSISSMNHWAHSAWPSPKQLALTVCGLSDVHQAFTSQPLHPNQFIARRQRHACRVWALFSVGKTELKHWWMDTTCHQASINIVCLPLWVWFFMFITCKKVEKGRKIFKAHHSFFCRPETGLWTQHHANCAPPVEKQL